jgi:1,4-dihydroxy-2-naphthoate octaprenyltransferase
MSSLLIASRPWSLPASLVPCFLAGLVSCTFGGDVSRVAAAAACVCAVHLASNLLNTLLDFRAGLDTAATSGDRALVDARVSQTAVLLASSALFCAGGAGLVRIAWPYGATLLPLAYAGVAIGLAYSAPHPFSLKALAGGDAGIFLAFGPLVSVAVAVVAHAPGDLPEVCGQPSLLAPFACVNAFAPELLPWSCAAGLLTVQILHANNVRDLRTDRAGGVTTVAGLLGYSRSRAYFAVNFLAALLLSGAGVILHNANVWRGDDDASAYAFLYSGAAELFSRTNGSAAAFAPLSDTERTVTIGVASALVLYLGLSPCTQLLQERLDQKLLRSLPEACAAFQLPWLFMLIFSCEALVPGLPHMARLVVFVAVTALCLFVVQPRLQAENESAEFRASEFVEVEEGAGSGGVVEGIREQSPSPETKPVVRTKAGVKRARASSGTGL